MKLLISIALLLLCFSSNSLANDQLYPYVKKDFFGHYKKLKTKADLRNKPIVLIAGFNGCIGCDELKYKVKSQEKKFNEVAEFMWMSIKAPDSFLFYGSLGIKFISSAPETFLINPGSSKAISMNRKVDIDLIRKLSLQP